jgi:hypothetical protein
MTPEERAKAVVDQLYTIRAQDQTITTFVADAIREAEQAAYARGQAGAKKLYVWEGDGVLDDYTNGLVCVIADSPEQAWALLEEKDAAAWLRLQNEQAGGMQPKEHTSGVFLVHGGA